MIRKTHGMIFVGVRREQARVERSDALAYYLGKTFLATERA